MGWKGRGRGSGTFEVVSGAVAEEAHALVELDHPPLGAFGFGAASPFLFVDAEFFGDAVCFEAAVPDAFCDFIAVPNDAKDMR